MVYKLVQKLDRAAKYMNYYNRIGASHMTYHGSGELHEDTLPSEWYEKVFPKMEKLTTRLHNLDLIDGRLVNITDDSTIVDERLEHDMHTLKSLVRVFIASPLVQRKLRENAVAFSSADAKGMPPVACFREKHEREPMVVDSLTTVSNFLGISAQQRKLVRFTICPQVTQYRIWTGALKEILDELKSEMDSLNFDSSSRGSNMGRQIISSCLKLLAGRDTSYDQDSFSWMRIGFSKRVDSSGLDKWKDVLEMFNDLIEYLEGEKRLAYHVTKLMVMKEGLSQIKDVLIDRGIAYKESLHQESLVQKKLSKTLGHSSRCLFTLLLFYLCGHVRNIEIDLRGGIHGSDGRGSKHCLCMGRIITSDEEKMVLTGVKQLDKALRLFEYVWETAGMKDVLELQGHLWCVGAKDTTHTYRGKLFFVHGIRL